MKKLMLVLLIVLGLAIFALNCGGGNKPADADKAKGDTPAADAAGAAADKPAAEGDKPAAEGDKKAEEKPAEGAK